MPFSLPSSSGTTRPIAFAAPVDVGIIDIAAEQQRAIIFSSHIVSDMERIANQVWLLKNGALAFQGPLDDLKESVVRLHFPQTLTEVPNGLTLVRRQQLGSSTTLTVQHWRPEQLSALQQTYPALQVEYLSLEEIFLELNR